MRLLFLIEALTAGGAERQLVNLMNGLSKNGHKVYLVTWVDKHHFKPIDLPNVNWIQFKRNGKFDFSLFRLIRTLIRDNKINAVQGFLDTGNLYAWLCTRLLKDVQVFASERSSKRKLKGLSRFHKPLVHKLVTKTIANSEAGKLFVKELSGIKTPVEVIRNGFDNEYFKPVSELEKGKFRNKHDIDENALVFINVARIIPLKRQLEIVIAFSELFLSKNAMLILIGQANDQYIKEISDFISNNNLEGKVKIFPPSAFIQEYYQLSDIFILNSDYEGSPNTLVEAMLCGLVVITTRCGDAAFYVENTFGNELIPTKDFHALKKSMVKLAELTNSVRGEVGKLNYEHLTKNIEVSIESLSNKYEKIYQVNEY
ncbi:MAG: hypothetical protein CFE21_00180 [Bacteroidetes bacterium B1(2017)]|nr:MAG: hypothetical protein CFE21_00180 [Bacteroidetes bacterium B1(2017)]